MRISYISIIRERIFDDSPFFPLGVPLFDRHPLVAHIFTPTQGNLQFDAISVLILGFQRHTSHALLFGLLKQFAGFGFVCQQSTGSGFFMLKEGPSLTVFANVHVHVVKYAGSLIFRGTNITVS